MSDRASSPAALEAEIVEHREQLAATIDELQTRVKAAAVHQAKVAGIAVGAVAVVIVGVIVVRRLRH